VDTLEKIASDLRANNAELVRLQEEIAADNKALREKRERRQELLEQTNAIHNHLNYLCGGDKVLRHSI
jgi:hypothetical protein